MTYSKFFFVSVFGFLVSCAKDNVNLAYNSFDIEHQKKIETITQAQKASPLNVNSTTLKVNLKNEKQSSKISPLFIPLLIFYVGVGYTDSKKDYLKSWLTHHFDTQVKLYSWDESSLSIAYIQNYLKHYSTSPIALLGHSYGGDTAYKVANSIKEKNSLLLVTLDAVGHSGINNNINCPEFYDQACEKEKKQRLRPSSVLVWYNVWVSGAATFGDIMSNLGGAWREQTNATKNIFIKNSPHGDLNNLIDPTDDIVSAFLSEPISKTRLL